MAPIAAIIDKTTPSDKVIKLFYSTGNARLGLALWSGTKDPDPENSIKAPQEVGNGQYILNPSQIASINFQGEEKVFALTTESPFKVTRDDAYSLSEIFPSYKKLQDIVIGNITLAACASNDNAWVYFTKPIGESSRSLWELDLRTSQTTQLIFTHDLWINSFAAAWFDTVTGKRSVIYEGSALTEYVVDDATNGIAISATGDMQRNTPVAVAFNAGTIYLYYCGRGTAGGIRRTVKNNGRWGTSTLVNSNTIAQDSQLTVVRANGINHLFYVARDENEEEDDYFVHHLDEVE